MERLGNCELRIQGLDQRIWKNGDSVFCPFSITDQDLEPHEVQILDAQTCCFEQTQTRSIEQSGDQSSRFGFERLGIFK